MSENHELKVPPLGESVSEATVARWTKKSGDLVCLDEILVELETDKVTLEVTSPAKGILKMITHPQGTSVKVGDILGIIESQNEQEVKKITLQQELISPPSARVDSPPLSPAVRRLVVENNINPMDIPGTGKGNRLTKTDIITHLEIASKRTTPPPIPQDQANGQEERVPMTRVRQRIAQRLKQAQNTAAILTTFNEVDMSAINTLRMRYKEKFEKKYGIRLGFMSFFLKAAVQALKEFPAVNAEIEEQDIIYKNYYDIAVAVSASQGLVVPVVRGVDLMSFSQVETRINELGIKAREGKLGMEDITGGTFTISNGGVFGSLMSTPILNPPQTGILGMHKIQDRPVAIEGKIEIRPMMYIALSYDHRLIDGREAVTFLVRIKENIENPERLLLEI